MAFGAILGAMAAGAIGQTAGYVLGGGGSQNPLIKEAISDIEDSTRFKVSLYRNAGSIAKSGAKFQADVYRQAGTLAELTAEGNIAQEQANQRRAEEATGRQLTDVMSKNYTSTAANGISLASKSTMMVQNEVMNTVTRTVIQGRNDSLQRQSAARYNAALTKMQYENQARAAIYSGDIQAMQYENQARAIQYESDIEVYKIKTGQAGGGSSIGEQAGMGALGGLAQGLAMGML